jgi:hypothetical protein
VRRTPTGTTRETFLGDAKGSRFDPSLRRTFRRNLSGVVLADAGGCCARRLADTRDQPEPGGRVGSLAGVVAPC